MEDGKEVLLASAMPCLRRSVLDSGTPGAGSNEYSHSKYVELLFCD